MRLISILLALCLCACEGKPSENRYTPPSKEQTACLANYHALWKQELKEDLGNFIDALKDDDLIRYELTQRRNKERLCMIKANCYDRLKGIEFSDCVNDVIPEQYYEK